MQHIAIWFSAQDHVLQSWKALFTLEERRKAIGLYWQANKSLGKRAVVGHFVSLGVPERSVCRNLGKMERGENLEKKSGSGRQAVKLPVAVKRRLFRQSCNCEGDWQPSMTSPRVMCIRH